MGSCSEDAPPWQYQRGQWRSHSRRRRDNCFGDAQCAEVDIGTIWWCTSCGWCWAVQDPPETITVTDQDLEEWRPTRRRRYTEDHANGGPGWSEAGLGCGKTAESKKALEAAMELQEIVQKGTGDRWRRCMLRAMGGQCQEERGTDEGPIHEPADAAELPEAALVNDVERGSTRGGGNRGRGPRHIKAGGEGSHAETR